MIYKGHKFDIEIQCPIPFGTYVSLHYAKRVINKNEPHTENGIILYLTDRNTHNMIAWTAATPSQRSISSQLLKRPPVISDSNLITTSYYHIFWISLNHLVNIKRVINQIVKLKIKICAAFPQIRKWKILHPTSALSFP